MSVVFKALSYMMSIAIDLLPDSPFRGFIDNIASIPYISFFNYFVPVSDFVAILTAWGTAIGLYYVVSAILRTVNAID